MGIETVQQSPLNYDNALLTNMQSYFGLEDRATLVQYFETLGMTKDDGG